MIPDLDMLRCALSPILTDGGTGNTVITSVENNAARVRKGSLFCAVKGAKADGHDFIPQAEENGAAAYVVSALWNGTPPAGKPVLRVKDPYYAWAILCEEAAGRPADDFRVHTVTGTNGKTTIAFVLRHLLKECGAKTGLLTTVLTDFGDGIPQEAAYTMPDAALLQQCFCAMKKNAITDAVMECSSHGLHQHRCGSLFFSSAIFTNLTGDHLDYHGTMEAYYQAKRLLFTEMLMPDAPCVINTDDAYGKRLYDELRTSGIPALDFSAQHNAFCHLTEFQPVDDGSVLHFELDGKPYRIKSKLRGEYNAVNLLEAVTDAFALDLPAEQVLSAAESVTPAPGRLDPIRLKNGATAFVDFAHTHDALAQVLPVLRKLLQPGGRIVTVFGCGGDRDRTKRPKMGAAAAKDSDICYVTSDNPRSEDPEAIIKEILAGIPEGQCVFAIADRAEAIRKAAAALKENDILLVAGKGHETTQEIKGVKHPFRDMAILQEFA